MKFRDRMYRFFACRNGSDQLSMFLLVLYLVLFIVRFFVDEWAYFFLNTLGLAILIYSTFRMFSKNVYKRRAENAKFMETKRRIGQWFKRFFNKWKYRKTHVYRKCPCCNADLRLPKKKGNHSVKCPKCNKGFQVDI